MIELTENQRQELKNNDTLLHLLDPVTTAEYVLVPVELFARLQELLENAEDSSEQEGWADAVEEARSEMSNE
jgi:hypothetical protein